MTSLKEVLRSTEFKFNKSLGQNFISDKNLLDAIVSDSGVTSTDTVVEIGTGGGTLTRAIAEVAKKVVSFEVDRNLKKVFDVTLMGVDNAEVVFADVLRMSDKELCGIIGADEFKVIANLPYYVTTPMLMRFLESPLNVRSLTLTVQREVAERFTAKANTPEYGAITLAIEACAEARITRKVDRRMFYPVPNVDSAVVRIDVNRDKLEGENFALVHKLVRVAFSMRRKTLANNIGTAFSMDKQLVTQKLAEAGFAPMVRGEALSLDDFVTLSHHFSE